MTWLHSSRLLGKEGELTHEFHYLRISALGHWPGGNRIWDFGASLINTTVLFLWMLPVLTGVSATGKCFGFEERYQPGALSPPEQTYPGEDYVWGNTWEIPGTSLLLVDVKQYSISTLAHISCPKGMPVSFSPVYSTRSLSMAWTLTVVISLLPSSPLMAFSKMTPMGPSICVCCLYRDQLWQIYSKEKWLHWFYKKHQIMSIKTLQLQYQKEN